MYKALIIAALIIVFAPLFLHIPSWYSVLIGILICVADSIDE